MASLKFSLASALLLSVCASAAADKKEVINGVHVESGKEASTRTYTGKISKSYPYPLATVRTSVVNFPEKCNNAHKDRRRFSDKSKDCKYHNENLVETLVIKDIKSEGWTKVTNEVERYLLGRRIYNRGNFGYYELVKVVEGENELHQKTVVITTNMLNDSEAGAYTKPAFEKDSAFTDSESVYTLTEVGPKETTLSYSYTAETNHWILNKAVSVPQVFSSISRSINDLVENVATESSKVSRGVASN